MKGLHGCTLRFICSALCVWLLLGEIPAQALGGEAAEYTVGYSSQTARENENAYENAIDIKKLRDALTGEYVDYEAEQWYQIKDADGLLLLSRLVNEVERFRTVRVCLKGNIDLSGISGFAPIGNGLTKYDTGVPGKSFQGTFDGCGYCIDGLNMRAGESESTDEVVILSLFGVLGKTAKVQNLVIGESCKFTYTGASVYSCTAGLAGRVLEGATVQNVLSLATVSGGYCSGGLVARLDNSDKRTAAIQSAALSACSFAGEVDGRGFAGGLIGLCHGGVSIQQSKSSGNVSATAGVNDGTATGGIVGGIKQALNYNDEMDFSALRVKVRVENAVNEGRIASNRIAGGLIGSVDNTESDGMSAVELSLQACRNLGGVTASRTSDGSCSAFVGQCVKAVDVSGCEDASGKVRFHGSQVRESDENTYSVRLVGSIADLEYREIGFYVTVRWNGRSETRTLKCRRAFETMTAGQNATEYTAAGLRGGETPYLYAMTVSGIPGNSGTVSFSVTPYGVREGSNAAETGEEYLVVYRNGDYQPQWKR